VAGVIYGAGQNIKRVGPHAGDRTNPRSFNWSDRPIRPGNFCPRNSATSTTADTKSATTGPSSWGEAFGLQKEIYGTVVEMQDRFKALLKPGITTHDLARWRPRPGENFKTPEQIKKWRATWSNHMGSTGIAWDSSPCYFSLDDPEIKLEKNMVLAYHSMLHAEGRPEGWRLRTLSHYQTDAKTSPRGLMRRSRSSALSRDSIHGDCSCH